MISKKLYILLVLVICYSNQITYPANRITTQAFQELCSNFQGRNELISESSISNVKQYNNMMMNSFSQNGSKLIKDVIQEMDYHIIFQNYPKLPQELGIFVGPFILGLIVLLLTFPVLLCCCLCPESCPPCKCFRQKSGKSYSKCQLIWPGVVLMIAFGMVLAVGATGLARISNVKTTAQSVGCSVSIIFDDLLYGHGDDNNHYFIGVSTFSDNAIVFYNLLPSFLTHVMDAFNNTMLNSTFQNVQNNMSLIPNGTPNGQPANFSYQNPFNSTPLGQLNVSNVPSTFPSLLGSISTSGVLNQSSTQLNQIQDEMNSIFTNATIANLILNGSNITLVVRNISSQISNYVNPIKDANKKFYEQYNSTNSYTQMITSTLTGFYAVLIGLSVLGIIATIFLIACNKYTCRYMNYFVCFLFGIIGFATFLIVTAISVALPLTYFTCDFTTVALSNKTTYINDYVPLINLQFNINNSQTVSECLLNGSGNIMGHFNINSSFLGDLNTLTRNVMQFNSTEINNQVNSAWGITYNLVNDYNSYKVPDFESPSDLDILNYISTPSNYQCQQLKKNDDSWIPAIGSFIPCNSQLNNTPTLSDCFNQTSPSISFTDSNNYCFGCLQTANFFNNYSNLSSYLSIRYPNCTTFIDDLNNTYNNYYQIKQSYYKDIVNRTLTTSNSITDYENEISSISQKLNATTNYLTTGISTITDPQYGVINGFNCLPIGEDVLLINNTACINGFQILFFLRILFGICSFFMLIVLYCSTCTTIRHFNQLKYIKNKQFKEANRKLHTEETKNNLFQTENRNFQKTYESRRFPNQDFNPGFYQQ